MGTVQWLGVGLLCLALAQVADWGRRHHRRYRRRLVSWRWDKIAEQRRQQSSLDRFVLRVSRPIGYLALPLAVLALAALAAAGYSLLT